MNVWIVYIDREESVLNLNGEETFFTKWDVDSVWETPFQADRRKDILLMKMPYNNVEVSECTVGDDSYEPDFY
jgi:hypothetical protein